jgi:hypothetical protein
MMAMAPAAGPNHFAFGLGPAPQQGIQNVTQNPFAFNPNPGSGAGGFRFDFNS